MMRARLARYIVLSKDYNEAHEPEYIVLVTQ